MPVELKRTSEWVEFVPDYTSAIQPILDLSMNCYEEHMQLSDPPPLSNEQLFAKMDRSNDLIQIDGQIKGIYIKKMHLEVDWHAKLPHKLNRFHFTHCQTVQDRDRADCYEKFHVADDITGKLPILVVTPGKPAFETHARLLVCKHCITLVNHHDNLSFPEEMDTAELSLLLHKSRRRIRKRAVKDADSQAFYAKDWSRISREYREQHNYTCEICKVFLGESNQTKRLLHTHHINSDCTNNHPSNLAALCGLCHDEQHTHVVMSEQSEAGKEIMRLRRSQGIYR